MMSRDETLENYNQLKELIGTQKVKLYYELSLPRSNSTAWQIAFCEAPEIDGQINEPSFHHDLKSRKFEEIRKKGERTLEDYCSRILQRLELNQDEKTKKLTPKTNRPIGLVINDLVTDINRVELAAVLQLTDKITITIRDPRIQGFSALTRCINDAIDSPEGGQISPKMALYLANKTYFTEEEFKELTGPGKDKINPSTAIKSLGYAEETMLRSEMLVKAIETAVKRCSEEYIEICWNNLKEEMNFIEKVAKPGTTLIILDGSDLLKNPVSMMRQSAKALGVTYTSDMVNRWKKATLNNFYCCITKDWGDFAMKNAWNGPVRNSRRFESKPDSIAKAPAVEEFPISMRTGLISALSIYSQVVKKKISPPGLFAYSLLGVSFFAVTGTALVLTAGYTAPKAMVSTSLLTSCAFFMKSYLPRKISDIIEIAAEQVHSGIEYSRSGLQNCMRK